MSAKSTFAAIASLVPMMHEGRWDSVRARKSGIPRRPRRSQPKRRLLARRGNHHSNRQRKAHRP